MKLTRKQRNALIKAGQQFRRQHRYADAVEVSDYLAGLMLDGDYGLDDVPATEISDYAYGMGCWVVGREIY